MRRRPNTRLHRRSRRGANAIEFALCLPVWLLTVTAILDYGWLYFHQTSLDMAANMGCRQGSLIDPGESDENVDAVYSRAAVAIGETLAELGTPECEDCTIDTRLEGASPTRTLVCEVNRPLDPLVGMVLDETRLTARQVARLEYQHIGL